MRLLNVFKLPTQKDRFAKTALKRIRRSGLPEARYDRERFAIVFGGGKGTIFLDNLYRDWNGAPSAERAMQMDKLIAFALEPKTAPDSFDSAAPQLLPVIRNRAQITNQWLNSDLDLTPDVYGGAMQPLCGTLAVLAAIDSPNGISLVNSKRLETWSRSLHDVLAVSLENLRERSPCRFERDGRGFYISNYGDFYDASRLLLPQIFTQLPLRGNPVAIAISRICVVVAGSEDRASLDSMAEFAEQQIEREARPIAYLPIVLQNGLWSPFDARSSALDRLRIKQQLSNYAEQKLLLEKRFAADRRDVFVATLKSGEIGEGLCTYAVWSSDVVTLLPEADVVVLRGKDGSMLVRRWSQVVSTCGPFPTEPDIYPPRHFVERGPDPAAWTKLATAYEHPSGFPIPTSPSS
jgi:hypothetical protein